MQYIAVILIGYLIGTINPAILITKHVKSIDIRDVNSKNAGTSNVAITLGFKYALIVGVIDVLKGLIPVITLTILYPDNEILWFIGGLSIIVGHIYPIFMNFRGGKGIATFGGMCIAIFPIQSLILLLLFTSVTIFSKYIAISSVLLVIIVPIFIYFSSYDGISILLVSLFSLLAIYKHISNLLRIYNKSEIGLNMNKINYKYFLKGNKLKCFFMPI